MEWKHKESEEMGKGAKQAPYPSKYITSFTIFVERASSFENKQQNDSAYVYKKRIFVCVTDDGRKCEHRNKREWETTAENEKWCKMALHKKNKKKITKEVKSQTYTTPIFGQTATY